MTNWLTVIAFWVPCKPRSVLTYSISKRFPSLFPISQGTAYLSFTWSNFTLGLN